MWFLSRHPAAARRNTAEAIKNKITRRHLVNGIQTRAWSYTSRKQSYGFDKMKCIKKKRKKGKGKKELYHFLLFSCQERPSATLNPSTDTSSLAIFPPRMT